MSGLKNYTERVPGNPQVSQPARQETILEEAQRIVYGERAEHYGHPSENFKRIVDLWNGYLRAAYPAANLQLSIEDVAIMNILQKIARLINHSTHRDSIVDIAGYAAAYHRAIQEIVGE